jgi:cytidine deaminase
MEHLSWAQLPVTIQADFALAEQELTHSFPPNHSVKVGAVLRAGEQVFRGANIRRRGFSGSTCAERMVLDQALYAGARHLDQLVVILASTTPGDTVDVQACGPCGLCRQQYMEAMDLLGSNDLTVYFTNEQKQMVIQTSLVELLPCAYRRREGITG